MESSGSKWRKSQSFSVAIDFHAGFKVSRVTELPLPPPTSPPHPGNRGTGYIQTNKSGGSAMTRFRAPIQRGEMFTASGAHRVPLRRATWQGSAHRYSSPPPSFKLQIVTEHLKQLKAGGAERHHTCAPVCINSSASPGPDKHKEKKE